ncbi:MAG: transketolase [Fusobacteriaceae bacterium]
MKNEILKIRKDILNTIFIAGSGHPGGSLSGVELLYVLYKEFLKFNPKDPNWENRDRVIVSKGHCSPLIYSILSHFEFFPKEELKSFRKLNSRLQGHVHKDVPGVELSTGSLGQGLSFSVGVALGANLSGKNFSTYCYLGDGELQEGSVWEAAMSAGFYKLTNLCAIVDYNKVQENGYVEKIMPLYPLKKKFESFGWHVIEINGHSVREVIKAYQHFLMEKEKPCVIIANTIKGKGVSFMEYNKDWHGKAPNAQELNLALEELGGKK